MLKVLIFLVFLSPIFWMAGCAHVDRVVQVPVNVYHQILVFLHIEKSDSEESSSKAVCLLDPTQSLPAETSADKPLSGKIPAVVITDTTHDFGLIGEDRELVHHFYFRNAGEAELRIKKILPG